MKKVFPLIFVLIFISLSYGEIILQFDDPLNDDFGDGKVSYPEHPMFTPGIFDIEQFRIEEEGENYFFIIRVRGKIEYVKFDEFEFRYDLPETFIFPLVQIYIDTDHKTASGIQETISGANLTINENSAWERTVIFSSLPDRFQQRLAHYHPAWERRILIPDKIFRSSDKQEISVKVPRVSLGEIQPDWGFLVLMCCHDVASTIKKNVFIMEVKSTSSLFTFGGGEGALYHRFNPNVIDIIVPPFQSQKKILSNYDKDEKLFAEVEAVYPFKSELTAEIISGEVKQVSDDKVVINLGGKQGVHKGMKLIIASRYIVEVDDVFPELCLAHFANPEEAELIEQGMKVTIWQE